MEKKIKDYLPLYFGQKCKIFLSDEDEKGFVTVVGANAITIAYNKGSNVKLILRPTNSVTIEEAAECYKIIHKVDSKGLCEGVDLLDYIEGGMDDCHTPEVFFWTIKKGFDIFGLIKADIAIDATKIKSGKIKTA